MNSWLMILCFFLGFEIFFKVVRNCLWVSMMINEMFVVVMNFCLICLVFLERSRLWLMNI